MSVVCEPGLISTADALDDVVTIEEGALEGYRELLVTAEADGVDSEIISFLRNQVAIEQEHVAEFRELIERRSAMAEDQSTG